MQLALLFSRRWRCQPQVMAMPRRISDIIAVGVKQVIGSLSALLQNGFLNRKVLCWVVSMAISGVSIHRVYIRSESPDHDHVALSILFIPKAILSLHPDPAWHRRLRLWGEAPLISSPPKYLPGYQQGQQKQRHVDQSSYLVRISSSLSLSHSMEMY
jgi:hypothetical protein